jgi:surface protein
MNGMFSFCKSLISLDLSGFDVSKVTDIGYMFHNCQNMKYLDISHFSPLNLKGMKATFRALKNLIYLNLGSLEINNDTDTNIAFEKVSTTLTIYSLINQICKICYQVLILLIIVQISVLIKILN